MLIELMIVLAIAAILLALAIPAYNGFAVRAKIAEALHLAAPIKVAVTESLQEGACPRSRHRRGRHHAKPLRGLDRGRVKHRPHYHDHSQYGRVTGTRTGTQRRDRSTN